ncbi:hypothetical protein D0C36_21710 [Mucilaginibacter conchicola]|uniref:DUF3592 domain-containing protein n=1 Tax=Mucilaginibacter conchicola TaxID=2303333 RepID=A0A372NN93_9SPHI|nr:hypothetical protein [Mucilaginibacter conchicola]RFZ90412.1 hypothetical protein D0C36_21710 [Mucilaginibacter conchicola]
MAGATDKQLIQKKAVSDIKPFYRVLLWAIRAALFIAACVLFYDRSEYIKAIEQNHKVLSYNIEGCSIIRGGKFRHYEVFIRYENQQYKVGLTDQQYVDIQSGKLPDFYYVQSKNAVIAAWEVRSKLNLAISFIVFFCCTFLPAKKIEDKILNSEKPSWLKVGI